MLQNIALMYMYILDFGLVTSNSQIVVLRCDIMLFIIILLDFRKGIEAMSFVQNARNLRYRVNNGKGKNIPHKVL